MTDDSTGLGDLLGLRDTLKRLVRESPASGAPPALVLLDIDRFKWVNDAYGWAVGDDVLATVAARLDAAVAQRGAAFRTGADEYVLLLDSAGSIDAVAAVEEILGDLRQPIETEGARVTITASAAIVLLGNRDRADGILRDADVTMYRAKLEGGNRADIYNWELDSWARARKRDVDALMREMDELRLQNQVLTEAMTIDTETGMPNALAFDADHMQLHARRSRSAEPYSVLLASVDGFGDAAGLTQRIPGSARVIKTVGRSIADTIRLYDRAYRVDENMFAVLFQGTDLRQAVAAAERVRMKVEKLALEHPCDQGAPLTVTVAVVEAGFRHSDTKEVLTEALDLLAEARVGGHNRVLWPH